MRRCWRGIGVAVLGLLVAVLTVPVQAQQAQGSSRWMAFVGCWEPLGAEGETGLLCFRPAGDGVEMSNYFEGEVTATEILVADGQARPVTAEGCTGTESVDFSEDGRRVFTASSFTCEGGEARSGTGIMSFIAPTQWIDVRSLTIEGEPVAWVQRYLAATSESLSDHGVEDPASSDRRDVTGRRLLAARDIDLEDVEEVMDRVNKEAAKAWLATHETELDLDGAALVRLADAGVPGDVIDVMVAVSHPEHFALTPEGVPADVMDRVATNAYRGGRRVGFRSFLFDPYYYSPFGYRYGYSPYGFSRFGSFGYGVGGYYGGYYGYVPTSIVVIDRNDARGGASGGRIIRGQGYRGSVGSSGGTSSGGSVGRTSSGGSRTSSGGSSGSSGGSSGSSGSSGGGRSAVPR